MKRLILAFCLLAACVASAQTKTYKFSKTFIAEHYHQDSAIGVLHAFRARPAGNVHPRSCDGKDGELHIGVAESDIRREPRAVGAVSSLAGEADSDFGIVAEPPNVNARMKAGIDAIADQPLNFYGYFRLWNEGHDVGRISQAIRTMFSKSIRHGAFSLGVNG